MLTGSQRLLRYKAKKPGRNPGDGAEFLVSLTTKYQMSLTIHAFANRFARFDSLRTRRGANNKKKGNKRNYGAHKAKHFLDKWRLIGNFPPLTR